MIKKLYLSVLVLVVAASMLAAGTMAWFTSSANAPAATFTAGTGSITADSSVVFSEYYDPDKSVYVYGIKDDGAIYEVDVKNNFFHEIYKVPKPAGITDSYSPNGLAFDRSNMRLYFAYAKGGNSVLYFYDLRAKEVVEAGTVTGIAYGATYGNGYYWYIANNSKDLYRISFHADGKINVKQNVATLPTNLYFGDVSIDISKGIIYGSTSNNGVRQFFTIDTLNNNAYATVTTMQNDAINLQLAFGLDEVLYGHSTADGKWYTVDPTNGTKALISSLGTTYKFTDLACGYVSVWNPGDTTKMRFTVTTTGSKNIHVRTSLVGVWQDALGVPFVPVPANVVVITPVVGSGWYIDGDYIYYNGFIAPGSPAVELVVDILLDGPTTGDLFQGKSFVLTGTMEAIQASNGASLAVWGITLPAPTP